MYCFLKILLLLKTKYYRRFNLVKFNFICFLFNRSFDTYNSVNNIDVLILIIIFSYNKKIIISYIKIKIKKLFFLYNKKYFITREYQYKNYIFKILISDDFSKKKIFRLFYSRLLKKKK